MIKKVIFLILSMVVIIGGAVAGVYMIQRRQAIEQEAAVPSGTATMSLNPPNSNSLQVGSTLDLVVEFNAGAYSVSGAQVKIEYSYTGANPYIDPTSVEVNDDLVQTYKWRYPQATPNCRDGLCTIEIVALQTGVGGYSAPGNTRLATIHFDVLSAGSTTLAFKGTDTIITSSSTGEDILSLPSLFAQSWTYSTGSAPPPPTITNTPLPTSLPGVTNSPTPTTPAATNTPGPSATPGPNPTATPTSQPAAATTPGQTLPTAGNGTNTLIFLFIGLMVMLTGVSLAVITQKT